jgi:outer membrane lipoprotein-sorting protein
MRNLLKVSLMAVAAAFVFSAFAATKTNAQVTLILKQMDARYKKLKTLRTNVIYESFDSILQDSETHKGTAIFVPLKNADNLLLRIDWIKPDESLAIVNRQYISYHPKLQQAYTGGIETLRKKLSGTGGALSFLNMSRAELKANFSIKYIGAEKLSDGHKTWHLELVPKTAQRYKKADIWIDGLGMPLQMKVTAKNNDTSTVLLVHLRKNVAIKGSVFRVNLPKGTRVIKN